MPLLLIKSTHASGAVHLCLHSIEPLRAHSWTRISMAKCRFNECSHIDIKWLEVVKSLCCCLLVGGSYRTAVSNSIRRTVKPTSYTNKLSGQHKAIKYGLFFVCTLFREHNNRPQRNFSSAYGGLVNVLLGAPNQFLNIFQTSQRHNCWKLWPIQWLCQAQKCLLHQPGVLKTRFIQDGQKKNQQPCVP